MNRIQQSLSLVVAIGVAGLFSAGCGKSEASAKPAAGAFAATCNKIKKTSKCDEYAEVTMGIEEAMCKDLGGTFSTTAACPTEARMGSCKKKSGMTYYYPQANADVAYTPDLAKLDCENPLIEGKYTQLSTPPPAPAAPAAPATAAVAENDAKGAAAPSAAADAPAKHGGAGHGGKHKKGR